MPITQLMDSDRYWDIVETSLARAYDQSSQEAVLLGQLKLLPPQDIVYFYNSTQQYLRDSYRGDLWCAAAIINNGCSDDGFDYFRCWLISRGREIYTAALQHPDDALYRVVDTAVECYSFETFDYVPSEAYEAVTGKDLYDLVPATRPPMPKIKIDWHMGSLDSLQRKCPKLFDLYGGNFEGPRNPVRPKPKVNTADFRRKFRR